MAFTRQIGSGQDFAVKGSVGNLDYVGVMDGHGQGIQRNNCIDLLRSYNYDEIASSVNPVDAIQSKLIQNDLPNSGSTFTFARINKETLEIEVFNVGDSKTVVIINNNIVYVTPEHTFMNESELERTRPLVEYIEYTMGPFPINDNEIHMMRSDVGVFKTGERLVPSQSFGHNNITGLAPSIVKIPYTHRDTVRVICGSDGFWDMCLDQYIHLPYASPKKLIKIAEDRWKQTWDFNDGKNKPVLTTFGNDYDDIAIAVWDSTE